MSALHQPGEAKPVAPNPGLPQRVGLTSLGVEAPIVPVGVGFGGALVVPDDPHVVGWWRDGARPGDAAGAVVLAGHVDTRRDGPGALFRLAALRVGDRVTVLAGSVPHVYVVRLVDRYPKQALPPGLFAPTRPHRLLLITCGGPFDRTTRQYADNLVVTATAE